MAKYPESRLVQLTTEQVRDLQALADVRQAPQSQILRLALTEYLKRYRHELDNE